MVDKERIELSIPWCKHGVIPFNYKPINFICYIAYFLFMLYNAYLVGALRIELSLRPFTAET